MTTSTTAPFTDEQLAALAQPLPRHLVKTRAADRGRAVAYLEGYTAIEQANAIFGYGRWGMRVDVMQYTPLSDQGAGLYTATVTVTVEGCHDAQDVGTCAVRSATPDQHDMAVKGAVTDAMKRALRHYGDQFGNALYGKDAPAVPVPTTTRATPQASYRARTA